MPRTLPSGLTTWLNNFPLLESHSTLSVYLPFSEDASTYYYATLPVTLDGEDYRGALKSVGELKLSMGRAADRVEAIITNVDGLQGGIFLASADVRRASVVRIGRLYYNPQDPTTQHHVVLFTGTISGISVDESEVRLTVVSDLYGGGQTGATRLVSPQCQFKFKDADTCGYSGGETTCNKLYDDPGGCSGRSNQHRFGGALFKDSKAGLQTLVGGPPAVNQLLASMSGSTVTDFIQRTKVVFEDTEIEDDEENDRTIVRPSGGTTIEGDPIQVLYIKPDGSPGTDAAFDYTVDHNVVRAMGGFHNTVEAINVQTYGMTSGLYASGSTATGTAGINSSTDQLTFVSSVGDFKVGHGIAIPGAGVSGATLYTTITDITGLVATLADNASTTVAGATVQHDDTPAIQAAIDAAASVGRGVHFPAGTYRLRTIQLLDYYWHLYGEGPGRSVLQAAVANQPVIEVTGQQAHTITIENLAIVGSGVSSGASGHGIYVHDNEFDPFNIVLRNLRIADCGGRGVYLAQHFTTLLERVDVRNCGGNAIELQGNNTCRLANCYVADVPSGKAGYRIYNGHPLFESCNGVDSPGNWGVFGKSAAEDGADNFCFPVFLNCNVEGWGLGANLVDGIRIKNGFGHFLGTTWFAGATGTNLRALRQDFVDANWNSIIDAGCQFYAPNGATQWANSQPVHSNGAPLIQFGALITEYYDTGASAVRTLPTIKNNLIAGSSNIATWLSRAKIEALEASALVGDLTGGLDFAGNVARLLLKAGTAGRPPLANADDTDTGLYWATDQIGFTINGSGKYSFHQNYFRADAPIGINTFPGVGYSFHSTNGAGLIVAATGATIPTMELRGGVNTHLLVNDTVASIQARLGTLAGAPDRAFVGSMTNHPFGLFINGAEVWTLSTSGHLAPQGAYDMGTASLPIRDLNLSRNIVFPSGVRQTFAPNATNAGINLGVLAGDPTNAQNADVWYNSTTGKLRTREGGTNKDVIQAGSGNITGSLVAGRVVLSNGANAITDNANLTYDLTSFINQRAGGNPNFQAIDSTNSITVRVGTLAGAPDRGIAGTWTNQPFVFYQNSAEAWGIDSNKHFLPYGASNARDVGSSAAKPRDIYIGRDAFIDRRLVGGGSAPTSSTGTGAGTSPSIVVDGSQLGCYVSITTGSGPATNAKVFDLTLPAAPNFYIATLTPVNAAAKSLSGNQQVFVSDGDATTTKVTVKSGSTGLAASTAYDWYLTFIAV